jgi:hypothetical protein
LGQTIGPVIKVIFGDGNDRPFRNVGIELPTNRNVTVKKREDLNYTAVAA